LKLTGKRNHWLDRSSKPQKLEFQGKSSLIVIVDGIVSEHFHFRISAQAFDDWLVRHNYHVGHLRQFDFFGRFAVLWRRVRLE